MGLPWDRAHITTIANFERPCQVSLTCSRGQISMHHWIGHPHKEYHRLSRSQTITLWDIAVEYSARDILVYLWSLCFSNGVVITEHVATSISIILSFSRGLRDHVLVVVC